MLSSLAKKEENILFWGVILTFLSYVALWKIINIGLFSSFVLVLLFFALALVRKNKLKVGMEKLGPTSRLLLLSVVFTSLAVQIFHYDSWRIHRDAIGFYAFTLVMISLNDFQSYFRAIFRFALFFTPLLVIAALLNVEQSFILGRFGGMFHPNSTALLVLLLALILLLLPYEKPTWKRYLVLVSFIPVFFLCRSRTGLAISIVYLLFWFAAPWRDFNRRHLLVPSMVFLTILVCSPIVYEMIVIRGQHIEAIKSITGRLNVWPTYLDYIRESPIFGIGGDGFFAVSTHRGKVTIYHHAHNAYLSIASTQGLIMLGLFLSIFLVALKNSWRQLRCPNQSSELRRYFGCCFLIILGGLIQGLTTSHIFLVNTIWGAIYWGAVLSSLLNERRPEVGVLNESLANS